MELFPPSIFFLAILTERNTPVARILQSGDVVKSDVLAAIKYLRKHPVKKTAIKEKYGRH